MLPIWSIICVKNVNIPNRAPKKFVFTLSITIWRRSLPKLRRARGFQRRVRLRCEIKEVSSLIPVQRRLSFKKVPLRRSHAPHKPFIGSASALSSNRSIRRKWSTYSDVHGLILQKNCIFPVVWRLQRCKRTFCLFYSSWFQSNSCRKSPGSVRKYSIIRGWTHWLEHCCTLSLPLSKAEFMPVCPLPSIFFFSRISETG